MTATQLPLLPRRRLTRSEADAEFKKLRAFVRSLNFASDGAKKGKR